MFACLQDHAVCLALGDKGTGIATSPPYTYVTSAVWLAKHTPDYMCCCRLSHGAPLTVNPLCWHR